MKSFMIPLKNEFMNTAAMESLLLAEEIKKEALARGDKLPKKIDLCISGATKLLTMEPVTRAEIMGILDTIGGYYCSLVKYNDSIEAVEEDRMLHAKELVRFAETIEKIAKPFWGLEVVK